MKVVTLNPMSGAGLRLRGSVLRVVGRMNLGDGWNSGGTGGGGRVNLSVPWKSICGGVEAVVKSVG